MSIKKMPWSIDTYKLLERGDLSPFPAPTPEQRLRVAAAVATVIRDENILGKKSSGPNAETIRAILVMPPEQWARDIIDLRGHISVYDAEDPRVRFEQIRNTRRN